MSRKRVHRTSHKAPEVILPMETTRLKDKKGKTPQLFQIPNNFSLWIAVFITIVLLILIIAGQTASSPQSPTTLQLPSQQNQPLPAGAKGMNLQALPGVNQLPSAQK